MSALPGNSTLLLLAYCGAAAIELDCLQELVIAGGRESHIGNVFTVEADIFEIPKADIRKIIGHDLLDLGIGELALLLVRFPSGKFR